MDSGKMSQADTKSTAKKVYGKQILANPDEYFTEEVMAKLEEIAQEEFSYG